MVYAELMHNPYLLKTKVCFNGQEPKINSQIEKYENQTLKNWVSLVPDIFYNEMNGYDFDLNFTGTKPDFEELRLAFKNAGVSAEEVRLFLKNELEDADTKSKEIDTLLFWLKQRRNRRFDWESFWEKNRELFDSKYPCIVIGGAVSEYENNDVAIENVRCAQELEGTVLINTPVIFWVNEDSMHQFRQDLVDILSRKDVLQKQLFFLFDSSVQIERTRRIILDLGVACPQILKSMDDENIKRYIHSFPMTEYVQESIKIFEEAAFDIFQILEVENKECEKQNADIHTKIDYFQKCIEKLKITDNYFVEKDYFSAPQTFADKRIEFEEKIKKWRNKKTKISGESDIDNASKEYEAEVKKYMQNFIDDIQVAFGVSKADIDKVLQIKYQESDIDTQFRPKIVDCNIPVIPDFPNFQKQLIDLQQITFEDPKTDFFEIFKGVSKEEKEKVRIVTCYYEQWRNKVLEIYLPIADHYIREASEVLIQYYDDLANAYHIHIAELLSDFSKQKESAAKQLSEEEQKLQEDNDWLIELQDQLSQIERG